MKTLSFTGTINCRESPYPRLLPFHTPFSPLFSARGGCTGASCCTVFAAVEIIHSTLNKHASFAETFLYFSRRKSCLRLLSGILKTILAAKEFERHMYHSMRIAGISPARWERVSMYKIHGAGCVDARNIKSTRRRYTDRRKYAREQE